MCKSSGQLVGCLQHQVTEAKILFWTCCSGSIILCCSDKESPNFSDLITSLVKLLPPTSVEVPERVISCHHSSRLPGEGGFILLFWWMANCMLLLKILSHLVWKAILFWNKSQSYQTTSTNDNCSQEWSHHTKLFLKMENQEHMAENIEKV